MGGTWTPCPDLRTVDGDGEFLVSKEGKTGVAKPEEREVECSGTGRTLGLADWQTEGRQDRSRERTDP